MTEKKIPGLMCATEENDYQILADERNLYFVRLGRRGHGDDSLAIANPSEFAAERGSVRMPKTGVESVRCTRVRGETVISIVRGGQSYRFVTGGNVSDNLLADVFDGLPLRVTEKHSQRQTRLDCVELVLFIACFALALLQVAGSALFGMTALVPVAGWLLIPPVWVACSAGRAAKGRKGFSMGLGLMAALFSCVFLWLTPASKPDDWMQAFLPLVLTGVGMAALFGIAGRKFRLLPMAAVAGAALLLYAPGAVLCLNELLPAVGTREAAASVVELTSEYDRGDYLYYVVAESESGQTVHLVSHDEYDLLEQNGAATIITTTGALGIEYTDLRCGG